MRRSDILKIIRNVMDSYHPALDYAEVSESILNALEYNTFITPGYFNGNALVLIYEDDEVLDKNDDTV